MLTSSIRWFCGLAKDPLEDKGVDSASMGKILNLIRFDAYEVAQRFWTFSTMITLPLKVVFSVLLIWRLLGWSCLVGIVTVLLAQLINLLFARVLISWEQERKLATDTKLHQISQFVSAIRHLRYYAWQDVWLKGIMVARQKELRLRVVTSLWGILISFTNSLASYMFPVVAFWALTTLSGQPLRIDIAFPALQLFTMLEESLRDLPNLITVFLNARVSLRRLDAFMNEPDIDKTEFLPSSNVAMRNASFAWPGTKQPVLFDISLSFQPGLNIIYGEVGAGKSALLQALLGELDLLSGEFYHTGEMIGYCGQTPWLQSMSIRENILFFAPYEKTKYTAVLEACALLPDLETFKHGDLSMIGENGVGLSGGQRARISLARAMYSRSKLLLLDDPLSALDHQTAELIVEKCFAGSLVEEKTIILVTHRTDLCLGIAKQVIHVLNGRASVINPTTTPIEAQLKPLASQPNITDHAAELSQDQDSVPEKFMEDEYRALGGVQLHVYWEYIKAASLKLWLVLVCVLALFRLVGIEKTWFLKWWSEAYNEPTTNVVESLFKNWPSPETDIRPWLTGFFFLALAQSVAYLFSQMLMLVIIYKAGKNLFERGMRNVTYATFRFYDVTPVGRLMNRLTSDMNTVDGNISSQFQEVAMLLISWVSSLIIIGSVTPLFLFFAVGLTLVFILIFLWALPTSQSLRRLEMVSLTPLISNFDAVTHGLATIRAYCASSLFQDQVIAVTDNFQKMDHFYWSLQAWLFYRLDILSALSSFILTILALFTDLSAGLAAFVFTASSNFVTATHSLCRQYGQLQMDFVSVERVVEILDIPQEQSGKIIPPASWPRYGSDIIFENVSIRYSSHLELALSDISLTIKGGTTTALTGRTGSGKSTLALAILATIHPIHGRIIIDGLDLATIDTQCLRSRITFLAQEPILFPGTLHKNLDPLAQYSATECASVLATITGGRYDWSLAMEIHAGGSNLSQGQRQLVGLARALLRRSPIVVLDEATASVDMDTATRVQSILREFLRESTIVTIAHRAEAVNEANTIVTLAKGQIERVEQVCT
ncbi:Pleiotropic ABC efflux transporter of multiple drugs [Podosphaera aphanis]|nr:Pleiotropic ABC efflux transporter of multiple drugs [Podosphaera aphanis]